MAAVRDGEDAAEEADRFRPDVILMDIGMPRLNGTGQRGRSGCGSGPRGL
ncbi:MAG TPA: hypothetical protein VH092_30155 [Urbifossiella sp.]|nr:hypothetical protein [Urbifossiella sp.]